MKPRAIVFALFAAWASGAPPALDAQSSLPQSPIAAVTELFPVEPGVNSQRGFAVSMHGGWLAVGARLDDERGPDAGAVYLFRRGAQGWVQRAKLTGSDPLDRQLGAAVALAPGVLVVGAPGQEGQDGEAPHGAVYVFREAGDGLWVQQARLTAFGRASFRQFGRAVAVDGDRLAVAALQPRVGGELGAVYAFSGPDWSARSIVTPRDSQADDRFGESLALAGDLLIAGAPGQGRPASGAEAGAAYVFAWSDGRWRQQARLEAPRAVAGERFGAAVAVLGDQAAVGAPAADRDGPGSGAAFVFTRAGQSWGRPARLEPEGLEGGEGFGAAVAIDGDLAVAGAPFRRRDGRRGGTASAFQRSGAGWAEVAVLEAADAERLDLFGFSVTLRGRQVVVGAPLADQGGDTAGAAYAFACDSLGCPREPDPLAGDLQPGDRFGVALAADAGRLAVGSFRGDPAEPRGAVYLFRRSGAGWRQEARLTGLDPRARDAFGADLRFAGDTLLVGAPLDDAGPLADAGSVYRFERSAPGWHRLDRLISSEPEEREGLGRSVAVAGPLVVAGASLNDDHGTNAGAAHLFGPEESETVLYSQDAAPADGFGFEVAAHRGTIAVGAPFAGFQSGAVDLFREGNEGWRQEARLTSAGLGLVTHHFGISVALAGDVLLAGSPAVTEGGSPGDDVFIIEPAGAVFVYERSGPSWVPRQRLAPAAPVPGLLFGLALDLRGDTAVVGAPFRSTAESTAGPAPVFISPSAAYLFRRQGNGLWSEAARVLAVVPREGDDFGGSVALGDGFFAVGAPGDLGGDRVTVFELRPDPEDPP